MTKLDGATEITLAGIGLHTGRRCSVALAVCEGPVSVRAENTSAERHELALAETDRGVRVRLGTSGAEVELVEHVFAALGGLGLHHGVSITVVGGEVPLLDGGARALCAAVEALGVAASAARLEITRTARYEIDGAHYRLEPCAQTHIDVRVAFGARAPELAAWNGSPDEFVEHVAPARTFGFASELDELRARGRAAFVDRRYVIALDDEGRGIPPHPGPEGNELARHKLLDLVGDLYLYGGPPRGRISAERPGHRANHAMVARALRDGALHST